MLSMRQSKQIGNRSPLRLRPSLSSLRILPVPLRAAPCLWSTSHIRRLSPSLSVCEIQSQSESRSGEILRVTRTSPPLHVVTLKWNPQTASDAMQCFCDG